MRDAAPEPAQEELMPMLAFPHRWYLTRKACGGCSCHFRHSDGDFTFGPRADWFPEDEDNIIATQEAYRVFRQIVEDGFRLDLIDAWSDDTSVADLKNLIVPLLSMPEESFRFFSGYRFEFSR